MRRLGVLTDPHSEGLATGLRHLSQAATRLAIAIHRVDVADPTAVNEAAAALFAGKPDALLVLPASRFNQYRNEIVQIAALLRVPAMYSTTDYVRAGGLLAYSADVEASFRRAAYFIDRLLRDAKPADLPIEQPTKFVLALNLRTAKTLGLSIPSNALVRADEVIQ
jgi:putative ABC transport system substrate-binding protein